MSATTETPTETTLNQHIGDELKNPDRGVSLGILKKVNSRTGRHTFRVAGGNRVHRTTNEITMSLKNGHEWTDAPENGN